MAKKTWVQKRDEQKSAQVKTIEKRFADIPEGSKMLIATPQIFEEYVRNIPSGTFVDIKTIRNDLAMSHNAEKTCPVTSGIFLRVVAEAAIEEYQGGAKLSEIAPFWRAIEPGSPLAKKLTLSELNILKLRAQEQSNKA